jgi:hypothetical protein
MEYEMTNEREESDRFWRVGKMKKTPEYSG